MKGEGEEAKRKGNHLVACRQDSSFNYHHIARVAYPAPSSEPTTPVPGCDPVFPCEVHTSMLCLGPTTESMPGNVHSRTIRCSKLEITRVPSHPQKSTLSQDARSSHSLFYKQSFTETRMSISCHRWWLLNCNSRAAVRADRRSIKPRGLSYLSPFRTNVVLPAVQTWK